MRFLKAIRYSGIGVFVMGIITVIQGCDAKEGAAAFILLLLLQFCSGPQSDDANSQSPTPIPTEIVFFLTDDEHSGNFGGRSAADALCVASSKKPSGFDDANVHAFISVAGDDEIRDMPDKYGLPTNVRINGPTGIKIADDWADLLDGTIDVELRNSGLGGFGSWWSGSNIGGSVSTTCQGWTNRNSNGHVGLDNTPNAEWIDDWSADCDIDAELICSVF